MTQSAPAREGRTARKRSRASNVKSSSKTPGYEPFSETIRHLTIEEWQQFLDGVEDYRHKLMMRVIHELGCRVGEFVRIQLAKARVFQSDRGPMGGFTLARPANKITLREIFEAVRGWEMVAAGEDQTYQRANRQSTEGTAQK